MKMIIKCFHLTLIFDSSALSEVTIEMTSNIN